ncbi:MAG: hypothetical protein ACE5F5_01535 [Acidimicrobiia bacterium]
MRRTIALVALAATAVLLVAPAVLAETDSTVSETTTETEVLHPERSREVPTLRAFGDGTAEFDVERGGIRLFIVGDVTIEGPSDLDVRIESWEGESRTAPESDGGTEIVLNGFAGSVFVRGAGYTVEAEGDIAVYAAGYGTAKLEGTGLWKTKSSKGTWPAELGFGD